MKKEYRLLCLVVGLFLFLFGISLIFFSPEVGVRMASTYLRNKAGGGMDADKYLLIMDGYISAIHSTGFVLSLAGIFVVGVFLF